jgi:hypothetical protein
MREGNNHDTKRNGAIHIRTGREPPDSPAPGAGRRNRRLSLAVLGVAALVTVVAILAAVGVFSGHAAPLANCAATPASAATRVTGGTFGIGLTHTTGVTIENSTISGQNATTGRVDSAIKDVYGDSTGMVIKDNDISRLQDRHAAIKRAGGGQLHSRPRSARRPRHVRCAGPVGPIQLAGPSGLAPVPAPSPDIRPRGAQSGSERT